MSRIIVKQLPKKIKEDNLRNLFGSKGVVTDVQLKYAADGTFRQIAFIGFQSQDEAKAAVTFFNNTCIQTNVIKVELCTALGAEEKPQSWSKYAKDSVKYKNCMKEPKKDALKEKKISKFDEIINPYKDDPLFKDFMNVHDKTRKLWGNDGEDVEKISNEVEEHKKSDQEYADGNKKKDFEVKTHGLKSKNEDSEEKLAVKDISDMDYMKSLINAKNTTNTKKESKLEKDMIDLFTIKILNIPYKVKHKDILNFFKPLKPYSLRLPTKVHGFCFVGFKTEKDMSKAMLKDKSFIKGKQVIFLDYTERNKLSKSKLDDKVITVNTTKKNAKWLQQEESLKNEEDISESGKIFFRNLSYTVAEDDIKTLFEVYGPLADVNLPVDPLSRKIKGFGTVVFVMPEHAVKAFNALDGSTFHGRLLHLLPGKSDDLIKAYENNAGLSYKDKKKLQLKKNSQMPVSWNSLFLGTNAVANILAKNFETSKEMILDSETGGSNAAVRIALGETQIVIETKKYLEDNGVYLNAFDSQTTKRSNTVLLAKNLPSDTTIAELTSIFAKFGPIARILLPPSGLTALIEFCEPSEAKQAFKKLAYSKFKYLPLYLEWAPENTFQTKCKGIVISKIESSSTPSEIKSEETKIQVKEEECKENVIDKLKPSENGCNDDDDPEPNTTIFLKNLNFETVQETVLEHFKHLGPIHSVQIAVRRDSQNPSKKSSLGYGFIQFKRAETASKALKEMQFTTIDSKKVELKRSDRTLKTDGKVRKKVESSEQTGTKILVRNIPFQAKVNEVKDIFKAFGELRAIRLPLKLSPGTKSLRGFGFVDFMTKSDAKKAFDAICQSTHLYGRRLVLEWASNTTQEVGEIRKRTASTYHKSDTSNKRHKAIFDATNIDEINHEDD